MVFSKSVVENTVSRTYCSSCRYPLSTCLCPWIKPIDSPLNIIILQHPLEAKHAKNTVKLLTLGLSNVIVYDGESEQDFVDLSQSCSVDPEEYAVCFPSEQSVSFESQSSSVKNQMRQGGVTSVIYIDASWRKALKMWHLNPWLHELPCWHFETPPENQYSIRKSSKENSLSTLEAVAYTLTTLCNVDCNNLLSLLDARQKQFLHH